MPSYDRWIIRGKEGDEFNPGQRLYWSNQLGWVDKASATRFIDKSGNLPIGAEGWEYVKETRCSHPVTATKTCGKRTMAGSYLCRKHRIAAGWVPKAKKTVANRRKPRLTR